jgi:sulfoxide reductase heme-binding subunit YedZ
MAIQSSGPDRHFAFKPLVFAASAAPLVFVLWDAFTRDPDIIYFNGIVRTTVFWSLRFLLLTLAITPLRWLTGWHFLIRFRKQLGH